MPRTKTLATTIAALVLVAAAATLNAQPRYETVHTFSGDRGRPAPALREGADGKFYGTTQFGGFYGKGTVFVTDASGNVSVLHEFSGADGDTPDGRLVIAPDGMLYGTTAGSANGFGTVYRLMPDGSAFEVVVEFTGEHGLIPRSGLVLGGDGALYGTTTTGGAGSGGTIFRLTTTGEITTLVAFDTANGGAPSGDLFPVADGFYGTTSEGGTTADGSLGFGTVFHAGLDGALTTIVVFDGAPGTGASPAGGVVVASDGSLYGTTRFGGGPDGFGSVFRITSTGLEPLHLFSGLDGAFPTGALRQLSDGHLYGTTSAGTESASAGTVFRIALDKTFTSLASFSGINGSSPASGVIQAATGAIYGTTETGGSGLYGTIYELTAEAFIQTIASFSGATLADPFGGLIEANDGNFYGIAFGGGAEGVGAVFRMTPDGSVTTLASFDSEEGLLPTGALMQASDGHLYGTSEGGATGDGAVFRVTLDGTLTTIGFFDFFTTGAAPSGRLIEGSDGYLYGTVLFGAEGAPGGVFRVDRASGTIFAAATFAFDGSNGVLPGAGVIEAPDGSLYGTAREGGTFTDDRPQGYGTIFRVSGGEVSTVIAFNGENGTDPASPLLIASDGHLYGTTSEGAAMGVGTLFRLTLGDVPTLSTLVSFDGLNGWWPFQQGVVETTPGVFTGSTTFGGDFGLGNLYQWSEAGGIVVLHQFDGTDGELPNATLLEAGDGALYGTAFGPQGGVIFRLVNDAVAASLAVAPATATYGGTTTLVATLTLGGTPIAGAEISFSLDGVAAGSAVTDDAGVATLAGVSVAGLNAGSYPGLIQAAFAGNGAAGAASATGNLFIARATPLVVVQSATFTYDGQPHAATATASGIGGEVLGPLTLTYNGAAVVPIDPGSYQVIASFEGNTNYDAASGTGTLTIVPAPAGLNGLVAAYGFNEGGGSIAGDASGRGHFGRLKQAQWTANGRFGGALDFDGVNDWVTVRDASALDIRNAITIEAWVNPRSLDGWNTILMKESDNGLAYALYANDLLPQPAGYLNIGGADRAVPGVRPLDLNSWTHVAMTYNGSLMRLFINGTEVRRRSITGRILASDGALRIGGNSVWGEYFDGLIDEVRVYNRALNPGEIKRDMETPVAFERTVPTVAITSPADGDVRSGVPMLTVAANDDWMLSNVQIQVNGVDALKPIIEAPFSTPLDLASGTYVLTAVARDMAGNVAVSAPITATIANAAVASYDFDEASGSAVLDGSGNNNQGVISGGVMRTMDAARGRVLSFNGSTGLVTVAASGSLALNESMTLEAWVRPAALSGWRTVILKERPDGLSYSLYASDNAPWPAGYVHIAGADGGSDRAITGDKPLAFGSWAHLAMTYDGTTMRLFVNGEEVASRPQSGQVDVSDGALRIGGNTVWGEWFQGQIDNVRIYGVAVGAAQIKADMRQ